VKGIQTLAFSAVFHLLVVNGIAAAVAFVPATAAVVVAVVTDSVLDPMRFLALARAFGRGGVQALTLLAVVEVVLFATAVPAIPVAGTVVVLVVALLVCFPVRVRALSLFRTVFDLGLAVFALALRAIRFFVDFGCPAAIPFVPVTTGIVVDIVTHAVANVVVPTFLLDHFASTFVFFNDVGAVQALAFFAEFLLVGVAVDAAAVAFVPIASGVVVLVVANAISNVFREHARAFDVGCALV